MVSFVFDDANDTDYLLAKPVFADYGAVASSAITTGFLGTDDHMDRSQVIALQEAGWEIMGHTATHPNLKSLSSEEIEVEFSSSNTELQRMGIKVNNIVYPYNKNNATVRSIAARYYRSGRGGTNSFNSFDLDPYFIKSFTIKHDIAGMKRLVDIAWNDRKWLVFYQHEINAKVKIVNYKGTFAKGEKLVLSPSGTVARYVATHWFPLYGYALYLVPLTGIPQVGDTVRGESSDAVAKVDKIVYNERQQLAEMLEYIKGRYPQMPVVTIDRGLDLLGVPRLAGSAYGRW